jgi:hypothetical protein
LNGLEGTFSNAFGNAGFAQSDNELQGGVLLVDMAGTEARAALHSALGFDVSSDGRWFLVPM